MEITRKNFTSNLSLVEEAIDAADFVSIDTEFTGLSNASERYLQYDTPAERYKKLCKNTDKFIQVQFGLCTFKWSELSKTYETKAFNFYIFPFALSPLKAIPDKIFSCQASSIDFLASQNFDFNKTFYHGVPFLRLTETEELRKFVDDKATKLDSFTEPSKKDKRGSRTIHLGGDLKKFFNKIKEQVQTMLDDDEQTEMKIQHCNSFYRKALHEHLPKTFENKIFLDYKVTAGSRTLMVYKGLESEHRKRLQEEKKKENEDAYHEAVGFSKVIKFLTEKKKLIIGHNMLYDVIYAIRQYVCELPEDLDEFKNLYSCVFSNVIDTKLMASITPFKEIVEHTSLNEMYTTLKSKCPLKDMTLEAPEEYQGEDEALKKNLHQAAYDAYITGYSYLLMFHHLKSYLGPELQTNIASSEAACVKPYLNKINMTHMYEVPYINLAGDDLPVSYDDVFYVTFPADWRISEIREQFSPFSITVSWINQTSCYARIAEKNMIKSARKTILGRKPFQCTIESFESYQKRSKQKEAEKEEKEENSMQTNNEQIVHDCLKTTTSSKKRSIDEKTSTGELDDDDEGVKVERGDHDGQPSAAKKQKTDDDDQFANGNQVSSD